MPGFLAAFVMTTVDVLKQSFFSLYACITITVHNMCRSCAKAQASSGHGSVQWVTLRVDWVEQWRRGFRSLLPRSLQQDECRRAEAKAWTKNTRARSVEAQTTEPAAKTARFESKQFRRVFRQLGSRHIDPVGRRGRPRGRSSRMPSGTACSLQTPRYLRCLS